MEAIMRSAIMKLFEIYLKYVKDILMKSAYLNHVYYNICY